MWPAHQGSSPLTRGALSQSPTSFRKFRLIPAHAGSTGPACPLRTGCRAHPRSRGEHERGLSGDDPSLGSSPLTRGARVYWADSCPPGGLIPAHAGSTEVGFAVRDPKRAHPRSRGEHRGLVGSVASHTGSSPLTRGARHREQATIHD